MPHLADLMSYVIFTYEGNPWAIHMLSGFPIMQSSRMAPMIISLNPSLSLLLRCTHITSQNHYRRWRNITVKAICVCCPWGMRQCQSSFCRQGLKEEGRKGKWIKGSAKCWVRRSNLEVSNLSSNHGCVKWTLHLNNWAGHFCRLQV